MTRFVGSCGAAARGWFSRRLLAFCMLASLLLVPQMAAAEDVATSVPSLKLVPRDAAFYSALLNGRELVEIVARSNFWKKVQQLDWYKEALASYAKEQQQPDSSLSQMLSVLELPENQQALAVVREMFSDEVFVYGNADICDTMQLASEVSNAGRFANTFYMLSDNSLPEGEFMARSVLNTLNANLNRIKVPDIVVGFRIRSQEPAEEQFRRLEAYAMVLFKQVPQLAQWRKAFKRKKVGDGQFLTLTLSGSDIPWDALPIKELEEKPGQYDKLGEKLRGLRLVVSLGIQRGYVLLSIGKSTDHLAALGHAASLLDEPRLKMLRDKGPQRYTAVSYVSQQFADCTGMRPQDVDGWLGLAQRMLPSTKLEADEQKRILTDIKDLAAELKKRIPKAGPMLTFAYLTPHGIEGYSSNWSENLFLDGSKKLPIATHLGKSPLLAIALRRHDRPQDYDLLVRGLVKGREYFEKYAVPEMDERDQARYKQVAEIAYPLLARLDHVQRKMLMPALADGQIALVLDGSLKSKHWHESMPRTEESTVLPMPALVLGVSDVSLLEQAMGEYRSIANDLIKKIRPFVPPNVPEFELKPALKRKIEQGSSVYYYPLPKEFGIDTQLAPNAGVSPKFLVLSLSPRLTVELLKSQALANGADGPLAGTADRPAAAVSVFDWIQFVDAVQPWVREGLLANQRAGARFEPADDDPNPRKAANDDPKSTREILAQVKQIAELLKAFRGVSAVAYVHDGAVVTHTEARVHDVP